MSNGVIEVSREGIVARQVLKDGYCEVSLPATVEGLREAARILAAWMDLPCEDFGDECRRIHAREQQDAFLREHLKFGDFLG